MSDESKRSARAAGQGRLGLDEEEIARLHRQAHGVIVAEHPGKPAPLPLEPEPTNPGAAGKTRRAPANVPQKVDDSATVPVPLIDDDTLSRDATPPPLPPSPAASAAEVWLEEAVTRPSAFAHLASQVGTSPGALTPSEGTSVLLSDPVAAMRDAHAQAMRSLRIMLILSSVTAFTLGLVLGVLLFR